jgi:AcrR family transcriptional regulator
MAFGKPGRPPADRLARQGEIFEAVGLLILERGVRRLSMPEAAHAACLSIGGLYHYFPTKRELVLHGLDEAARERLCRLHQPEIARHLADGLDRAIEAYLDYSARMLAFVRPSVQAALELGLPDVHGLLNPGWTHNVADLTRVIALLSPETSPCEREALGRAIRGLGLGLLVDPRADMGEWRAHARLLIDGHLARTRPGTLAAMA